MISEILKEQFQTDNIQEAMVKLWARDIHGISEFALAIEEVCTQSIRRMHTKPRRAKHLYGASSSLSGTIPRTVITDEITFKPDNFSIRVELKIFNDTRTSIREDDNNRNALNRQIPNIERDLNYIFDVMKTSIRYYTSTTSSSVCINIISLNDKCLDTDLFCNINDFNNLVYKNQDEAHSIKVNTQNIIINELQHQEGECEYSDREFTYSLLGDRIDALEQEISRLRRIKDELTQIRKNMTFHNSKIVREKTAERLKDEGWDDYWNEVQSSINKQQADLAYRRRMARKNFQGRDDGE